MEPIKWSVEEEELLGKMIFEGRGWHDISLALGRNTRACIAKHWSMKNEKKSKVRRNYASRLGECVLGKVYSITSPGRSNSLFDHGVFEYARVYPGRRTEHHIFRNVLGGWEIAITPEQSIGCKFKEVKA